MKKCAVIIALALLIAGCSNAPPPSGTAKTTEIGFEGAFPGQTPPGFTAAVTNGPRGQWIVREDPTSPAGPKVLFQQNDDPTNGRFPLCIFDGLTCHDADVSVAFKCVSGKIDQAAGIVVRYQDKDNYYVARANGLEDNVRLYKVQNGKRTQLAGVDGVKPPAALTWHILSLKLAGNHFEVGMDGQKLFEATDDTFPNAGKVGLWTKADSVTEFDDLRITVP